MYLVRRKVKVLLQCVISTVKKHAANVTGEMMEYCADIIVFALTLLRNKLAERGGFQDGLLGSCNLSGIVLNAIPDRGPGHS